MTGEYVHIDPNASGQVLLPGQVSIILKDYTVPKSYSAANALTVATKTPNLKGAYTPGGSPPPPPPPPPTAIFTTPLPTPTFDTTGVRAWYDFTQTNFVYVDTNITNTIGYVVDLMGNGFDFYQEVKEFQPDSVADGAFFNGTDSMNMLSTVDLLNNVNKYYMGAVVKIDPTGVGAAERKIIQITKASGSTSNRASWGLTGTTGGRKLRLTGSINDGTEKNTAVSTGQLTNSVFAYVEMLVDLSADTVSHYINGVLDSTSPISGSFTTTGSTPASNPLAAYLGNTQMQSTPFLGAIKALVIQSGALAGGQQASIQAYLASKAV